MTVCRRVVANRAVLIGIALLAASNFQTLLAQTEVRDSPERRAVAFLVEHVPKWHRENACYSCHNNGDAVRALALAHKRGLLQNRAALEGTLAFLGKPGQWDANGPDGPFKDRKLARIQFAAALTEAASAGLVDDQEALQRAGMLVAELQEPDGSWVTDAPGTLGSPATYGRALATGLSMRTLWECDPHKYARELTNARSWFAGHSPKSVLDAAAYLHSLSSAATNANDAQRQRAIQLVREGQSSEGGWGPFVNSPPEVFDTALVLLALSEQQARSELEPLIVRGREYLVSRQSIDGSWPATTRPPGAISYAQQLSTTGWAAQALFATMPR